MQNKADKSVMPPIPKISLRVINRKIEYGAVPEIIIARDTRVKVMPHFFSANKAEEETILIADGTSCRSQIIDGTEREAVHVARLLDRQLMNN